MVKIPGPSINNGCLWFRPNSFLKHNKNSCTEESLEALSKYLVENIDYNTVYANQLDRLTEMGFPNREHNLRLLIQTMGDIDRVIELLFR